MTSKVNISKINRNLFISEIEKKEERYKAKYPVLSEKQREIKTFSLNPFSNYKKIVIGLADRLEQDGIYYFADEFPYKDELNLFMNDICGKLETKAFIYQNLVYDYEINIKKMRLIRSCLSIRKAADVIEGYFSLLESLTKFNIKVHLNGFAYSRYSNDYYSSGIIKELANANFTGIDIEGKLRQYLLDIDKKVLEKSFLSDVFTANYEDYKKLAIKSDTDHSLKQLTKKDESK